jgi:hypothetical protein
MESAVYKILLSKNDNKVLFEWDLPDILRVIVR